VKRRLVDVLQKRLINPRIMRRAGDQGFRYALLETIGRSTGLPRQTPVGDGHDRGGIIFWIVAEKGRDAAYVRNIEANPRVRVRFNGAWHTGTAHPMPEDDPQKRLDLAYDERTAGEVRRFGSSLLAVRIDLDPSS
jgi:deazaflavin-dependent oxidoreductase (nitroreductase family)